MACHGQFTVGAILMHACMDEIRYMYTYMGNVWTIIQMFRVTESQCIYTYTFSLQLSLTRSV